VATSPVVYLDFWGSLWDSDPNGVQQYLQSLFSGLGDASDSWSTSMSQYTDGSGNPVTFGGSVLAGTWVDDAAPAPQSASQADIAAEAQNAASVFGAAMERQRQRLRPVASPDPGRARAERGPSRLTWRGRAWPGTARRSRKAASQAAWRR
jgi:hypothetical protein